MRRLNREDWLEESLRILGDEGSNLLTVERLCERLGVSRGSFYWHFRNREDFTLAIVEYWEQQSTTAIREQVFSLDTGPRERLLKLLELVTTYKYNRFELPMRVWAMRDPSTREVLLRMDRTRYEGVRSLFEEMGFSGDELEMRTQSCVIYYNFMDAFSFNLNPDVDAVLRQNRLRHRMLTRLTFGSDQD